MAQRQRRFVATIERQLVSLNSNERPVLPLDRIPYAIKCEGLRKGDLPSMTPASQSGGRHEARPSRRPAETR